MSARGSRNYLTSVSVVAKAEGVMMEVIVLIRTYHVFAGGDIST
jgi:hypothetical protein